MALSNWTGAVSEDLTLAGNWDAGGVPGNADTVIVPATASRGMQSNMTGLADTITSWYIAKGFKYNIGATGNQLDVSCTKFVDHGNGETWFKDGAGTTGEVQVRKPAGLIHLDGTTITAIYVLQGQVFLDSTLGATVLLDVGHNGNVTSDAMVTIAASGVTITALNQWGGNVKCGALVTAANVHAGVYEQSSDNLAISTLELYGGTVRYNSTATLINARCRGGVLDLMDDAQIKTVTNLFHYPGSRVIEDDGDIVTITNRNNFAAGFIAPTG